MNICQRYLIVVGLTLGACASSSGGGYNYKLPKETPPPQWQGDADVSYGAGTLEIHTGKMFYDSIFSEIDMVNTRNAVIGEDFTYNVGPMVGGTKLTLPKGSPLYARQFTYSLFRSKPYEFGDKYTQSRNNNPVEWCSPAPDDKGSVCLYWQSQEHVYVQSDRSGSPYEPRSLKNPTGDKQPLPIIQESPDLEFDTPLKLVWVIEDIGRKSIEISQKLGTYEPQGFVGNEISQEKISFDNAGDAFFDYLGGRIKFRRVSDSNGKSIVVTVIKTPQVPSVFETDILNGQIKNQPFGNRAYKL